MDPVRKKVLWDLVLSPLTILPVVVGVGAALWSAAMGGPTWLSVAAGASTLGGLGILGLRSVFSTEGLTTEAYAELHAEQRGQQKKKLDRLRSRLRSDKDPRTQTYLRDLRGLFESFLEDVDDGTLSRSAGIVLDDVDKLFRAAVKHLEHSYDLWKTASRLSGDAEEKLMSEREQVIQEVKETIEHLSTSIEQFHAFRVDENETELEKLRNELDQTMEVARRAEERVAALGDERTYRVEEFE